MVEYHTEKRWQSAIVKRNRRELKGKIHWNLPLWHSPLCWKNVPCHFRSYEIMRKLLDSDIFNIYNYQLSILQTAYMNINFNNLNEWIKMIKSVFLSNVLFTSTNAMEINTDFIYTIYENQQNSVNNNISNEYCLNINCSNVFTAPLLCHCCFVHIKIAYHKKYKIIQLSHSRNFYNKHTFLCTQKYAYHWIDFSISGNICH